MDYNKKRKLIVRVVAVICAVLIAGSMLLTAVSFR